MFAPKIKPDQFVRAVALLLAAQRRSRDKEDESLGATIDRAERLIPRLSSWILTGRDPVPRQGRNARSPVVRIPKPRVVNSRDD